MVVEAAVTANSNLVNTNFEGRPVSLGRPPFFCSNLTARQLQSAIMRIGFFGGSFDPPHLAHLVVARASANAFSLDRVLFVPTARQPLKPDGAAAPFADRLAMVALLCDLQSPHAPPIFEPSSLDAPLPGDSPNYTVDTLTRLRGSLSSSDNIFAIIGADAFRGLPTWRSPTRLISLAEWIVVSRPDIPLDPPDSLTPAQLQRIHRLDGVSETASATIIRAALLDGSDCFSLLPPSILRYIRSHHLYGT
jgi:nicotinate-nucleotide adenylyltransferase